jgi:hypothetical protein
MMLSSGTIRMNPEGRGGYRKGQSGNPGGRPKEVAEVRELARTHTEAAIARLAEWMASDDPRASVAASSALLDRGWGKATQTMEQDVTVHGSALGDLLKEIAGRTRGLPSTHEQQTGEL